MKRASKSLIPSTSATTTTTQTRSWRRMVAEGVALAQSAVELDSKNTDPMGALDAYMESVRHLRSILARLERHGAYARASQLAAIIASYSERMSRLCVVCAVPPPPYDYPPSGSSGCSCSSSSPTALPPPPAYYESSPLPTRAKSPLPA